MENNFKIPKQIVDGYILDGAKKMNHKTHNVVLMGFLAGMFIAFGACCSSAAVYGIANPGVAKLVAGVIFPVGLMLIILIGGELFTGDCLLAMGVMSKKFRAQAMIKKLALVFFSNMLGAVLIAMLVYFSGQYDMGDGALAAYTIKVAYGKATLDVTRAFTSGILCNIIVCFAVLLAYSATDVTGKLLAVFFPIMAFVIGGFEHCVANMYYIPAGIIANSNPQYQEKSMELYGYSANQLSQLNIQNFLIRNLLPVTLGNIVGGMVFVGLPLYLLHVKSKKNVLVDKTVVPYEQRIQQANS